MYAAGSLALFIAALFVSAASCLKLAAYPALGLGGIAAGDGASRRVMRALFMSDSSQVSVSRWGASRSLRLGLVICMEKKSRDVTL